MNLDEISGVRGSLPNDPSINSRSKGFSKPGGTDKHLNLSLVSEGETATGL